MSRLLLPLRSFRNFSVNVAQRYPKSAVKPLENVKPELIITDACVVKLKEKMGSSSDLLRVMVEGGGCSGFQYKFERCSKVNDDDKVFERDGAKVVIDSVSLDFVRGATVDYQDNLIKTSFVIMKNPLAEQGCSCGSSFAVRLD